MKAIPYGVYFTICTPGAVILLLVMINVTTIISLNYSLALINVNFININISKI
jgi:hypothetical protein